MISKELKESLQKLGWIALVFLLAGLVISAVEKKETSSVSGLNISIQPLPDGNTLINREDILLTLDRSFGYPIEGSPLNVIDVERMERVLEEDPFILDADVFVDARNGVNVKVKQREPILRIIDNNGLNYYLDKDGFKMPISKHFTTRVLVATGNIPPHVPDFLERKRHILKDLFELTTIILEDDFFRPMVEQIYVSNIGEITFIPIVGDHKIILGRFEDVEEKLRKLKIFYMEALLYEGWEKYETINLKYDGQVVCRKR